MNTTMLIVDDHSAFRTSARAMLEAEGFEVIGEAGNGWDAIAAADRLRPGVVLLDVRLPDLDGFAVAQLMEDLSEPPKVVLVSSVEAAVWGERLRDSPACGFLAKSELSGAALRHMLA